MKNLDWIIKEFLTERFTVVVNDLTKEVIEALSLGKFRWK